MRILRSTCIGLFVFFTSVGPSAFGQPAPRDAFIAAMDKNVPGWLEEFIVPGAALAIIDDGQVILQKGYGVADVEKGIPVTERTGFNIASISKTVSAWGVMRLVEQGTLDLDAPAEQYLKRWHLPKSEFDVNGVSIRRLLSHTAGLSLHGYPGWSPTDTLPTIEESLSGKTNGAGAVELVMEPGTRWQYSGGGYTLLQLIIEEVTGMSFADYMQKNVLDPLGMTNSSFTIDGRILEASSLEHNSYGKEIPFELFTEQAAAGLHTTIEDLTRFALASLQVNGSNPVLKSNTIDRMRQPAPNSNGFYGLGYSLRGLPGVGTELFGHGGSNAGWQCTVQLNADTRSGCIVVTNGATGRAVYDQVFAEWAEWKWKVDASRMRRRPIVPLLVRTYQAEGAEAAVTAYLEVKKEQPDAYYFSEEDINLFAYELMWDKKLDDALTIFQLNIDEHPYSFNPYDSYAEALLAKGDTAGSIANYRRSIELGPRNDNGRRMLEKLGVIVPPYVEPVSMLEPPVGWETEIITFPINFAPTIDLQGYEEIAFAPGWRDSTSQNLWSLVYVWSVAPNGDLSTEELARYLELYYDGLGDVARRADQGAEKTRCTLTNTSDGMTGELRLFDGFVHQKMMVLNVTIRQEQCAALNTHLIRFHISPKAPKDPVRTLLESVELKVPCK